MDSICRLCLGVFSKEDVENVFEYHPKHGKKSLVDVLFWVFSIEIEATDVFSKEICISCIGLTEHILGMAKRFQKNQEILQNGLNLEDLQNKKLQNEKDFSELQKKQTSSGNAKEWIHKSTDFIWSSPRINVPLSAMEALCPVSITIQRLEDTQEFLKYQHLGGGRYKKRKYRQFKMDDALVDNICNTLVRKKSSCEEGNWSSHFQTKAENTKHSYYSKNRRKSCNVSVKDKENILKTNHMAVRTRSKSFSGFRKDDTKKTIRRPYGRNKNFAVNTKHTTRTNIELGPKVYLKPLEWIIEKKKYKKIREGTYYVKKDIKRNTQEEYWEENAPVKSKKEKFLDYYKNYRTFAVRELITGKNINKKDIEQDVISVSNVQNVLVCEFCSKVFLTDITLNLHYSRIHKVFRKPKNFCETEDNAQTSESSDVEIDVETVETSEGENNIRDDINGKITTQLATRKPRTSLRSKSLNQETSDYEDGPYIWDRKKLGKYSAISYYTKNKLGSSGSIPQNQVIVNQSSSLNDTIERLSNRLEGETI